MGVKSILFFIGLAAVSVAASVGFSQLTAAPTTLLDLCPDTKTPPRCAAGAELYLSQVNPSDERIIDYVNRISAAVDSTKPRESICEDAAAGISLLAEVVDDERIRELINNVEVRLCEYPRAARHVVTSLESIIESENDSNGSTSTSSTTTSGGSSGASTSSGETGSSGGSSGASGG
jgi:hypothetical protein